MDVNLADGVTVNTTVVIIHGNLAEGSDEGANYSDCIRIGNVHEKTYNANGVNPNVTRFAAKPNLVSCRVVPLARRIPFHGVTL